MPLSSALRRGLLLLPLCAILAIAGCAGNRDQGRMQRLQRQQADWLYREGRLALLAGNYQEAVNLFTALTSRYSPLPQARMARLDIIYAYYKLGEEESARDAADTFIRENPTHEKIDYAYYLRGLVDFERTPFAVERWLRVDLAARPPRTADDAIKSFRTVVTEYPKSIYAPDARKRMVYLRNRLAEYELRVASHYLEREAWVAAAQRARQVIEGYDGAPAVKEALRVMIYCYRRLGYQDLAQDTARVFETNFPGESPDMTLEITRWWQFWK